MAQIEGKIAAILDRTTIVINRGSLDGVSEGTIFYVFSKLGPFNDPDTGEELGTITQVWGRVKVSDVEERLCLARTEYEWIPGLIDKQYLTGLFGRHVRIELPIAAEKISYKQEQIQVGTSVISQELAQVVIEAGEEAKALPAPSATDPEETSLLEDESGNKTLD